MPGEATHCNDEELEGIVLEEAHVRRVAGEMEGTQLCVTPAADLKGRKYFIAVDKYIIYSLFTLYDSINELFWSHKQCYCVQSPK
jgi:hypothetical protein